MSNLQALSLKRQTLSTSYLAHQHLLFFCRDFATMTSGIFLLLFCGIISEHLGNAQKLSKEKKKLNMKVHINATGDTLVMKFLRPNQNTRLEGFILGYGNNFFSNQYIQWPENGKSYITEVDAEPRYLISVKPNENKKSCKEKNSTQKPIQLVIGTLTPTSVFLSWGILINPQIDWSVLNKCPNDRFYTVRYKEKNKDWLFQLCPTTETVIDNLKPNTLYEFGVKDNTDGGIWSNSYNHKTIPKGKENGQIQNTYKIPKGVIQLPPENTKAYIPITVIKQGFQNLTNLLKPKPTVAVSPTEQNPVRKEEPKKVPAATTTKAPTPKPKLVMKVTEPPPAVKPSEKASAEDLKPAMTSQPFVESFTPDSSIDTLEWVRATMVTHPYISVINESNEPPTIDDQSQASPLVWVKQKNGISAESTEVPAVEIHPTLDHAKETMALTEKQLLVSSKPIIVSSSEKPQPRLAIPTIAPVPLTREPPIQQPKTVLASGSLTTQAPQTISILQRASVSSVKTVLTTQVPFKRQKTMLGMSTKITPVTVGQTSSKPAGKPPLISREPPVSKRAPPRQHSTNSAGLHPFITDAPHSSIHVSWKQQTTAAVSLKLPTEVPSTKPSLEYYQTIHVPKDKELYTEDSLDITEWADSANGLLTSTSAPDRTSAIRLITKKQSRTPKAEKPRVRTQVPIKERRTTIAAVGKHPIFVPTTKSNWEYSQTLHAERYPVSTDETQVSTHVPIKQQRTTLAGKHPVSTDEPQVTTHVSINQHRTTLAAGVPATKPSLKHLQTIHELPLIRSTSSSGPDVTWKIPQVTREKDSTPQVGSHPVSTNEPEVSTRKPIKQHRTTLVASGKHPIDVPTTKSSLEPPQTIHARRYPVSTDEPQPSTLVSVKEHRTTLAGRYTVSTEEAQVSTPVPIKQHRTTLATTRQAIPDKYFHYFTKTTTAYSGGQLIPTTSQDIAEVSLAVPVPSETPFLHPPAVPSTEAPQYGDDSTELVPEIITTDSLYIVEQEKISLASSDKPIVHMFATTSKPSIKITAAPKKSRPSPTQSSTSPTAEVKQPTPAPKKSRPSPIQSSTSSTAEVKQPTPAPKKSRPSPTQSSTSPTAEVKKPTPASKKSLPSPIQSSTSPTAEVKKPTPAPKKSRPSPIQSSTSSTAEVKQPTPAPKKSRPSPTQSSTSPTAEVKQPTPAPKKSRPFLTQSSTSSTAEVKQPTPAPKKSRPSPTQSSTSPTAEVKQPTPAPKKSRPFLTQSSTSSTAEVKQPTPAPKKSRPSPTQSSTSPTAEVKQPTPASKKSHPSPTQSSTSPTAEVKQPTPVLKAFERVNLAEEAKEPSVPVETKKSSTLAPKTTISTESPSPELDQKTPHRMPINLIRVHFFDEQSTVPDITGKLRETTDSPPPKDDRKPPHRMPINVIRVHFFEDPEQSTTKVPYISETVIPTKRWKTTESPLPTDAASKTHTTLPPTPKTNQSSKKSITKPVVHTTQKPPHQKTTLRPESPDTKPVPIQTQKVSPPKTKKNQQTPRPRAKPAPTGPPQVSIKPVIPHQIREATLAPYRVHPSSSRPRTSVRPRTRPAQNGTALRARPTGDNTWMTGVIPGGRYIDSTKLLGASRNISMEPNNTGKRVFSVSSAPLIPVRPTSVRRRFPPTNVTGRPGGPGSVLLPVVPSTAKPNRTTPAKQPTYPPEDDIVDTTVFSPSPKSDIDALGKTRYTAPHVKYMSKDEKIPCSITESLRHFPTEEASNQEATMPPQNPPSNLTIVTVEGCSSFVILEWEPNDNDTVTEYEVISKENGAPPGKDQSITTTNQTHSTVENLKPDTSYEFHVIPKNPLGEGPVSNTVEFNTESADPRVSEPVKAGKDAIWTEIKFKSDSYSECRGKQYVKRTWYKKFVGIQLCNSLRYKIYLSDSLSGTFYNIGDQSGFGEDHCQFVDSFLDGRTGQQLSPEQLTSRKGFYRSVRQQPVDFGNIGGNTHISYVHWYECGIAIPGKW
ncbi:target of Nesh-SH3 [Pelobates fuscus]|uniref:target of Nesh-SH3 n=1 Tax=Pelobates fuscus TaxID=191477 RepID=UPI002FE4BF55